MSITKSIGKNTLGGGNSMNVDLRTYNRSTHNLSYAWRSSMGVGTLVPCMKLVGLPGDTFDIDIDTKVLTHPTVGPLFGSYKMQIDIFTAPFRLYNAMLHNNALNVGLDMTKVKMPKLEQNMALSIEDSTHLTYSSSSIIAYLGRRCAQAFTNKVIMQNVVPWLAYLDIFKNYYANKQEDLFYYLIPNQQENEATTQFEYSGGVQNYVTRGSILVSGTEENAKNCTFTYVSSITNQEVTLTYDQMLDYFSDTSEGDGYWEMARNPQDRLFYCTQAAVKVVEGSPTHIESSNLTILDDLRESILKSGSQQFVVNRNTNTYFYKVLNLTAGVANLKSQGCGLILKTYQSDLFNNWVKSELISGENGISAITAISTAGDKFTIDQLNLSKKVYDMLNRIAVSGGTYQDWVETVYTSQWNMHTETPMYEGGLSTEIEFQEVVSNSASNDQPLGTLAGRGVNTQKRGGKLHIKVTEPCYIMGIVSITPRVDYCQGNDFDTYFETLNDLHKPALDGIGYQDLLTCQAAGWVNDTTAYGKTVAWINYMTNFNKTYGTFAENGNEAFMVLNRIFEPEGGQFNSTEIDNTSYIDPAKYNYIFAETTAESQNFWVQIGFGIEARRVMSAKQIPNL